jgi:hypothetical protein
MLLHVLLKVITEQLTMLFRIREVPGSNLHLQNGYPDCSVRGFLNATAFYDAA